MKEQGLFDEQERLNVLSKLGENLEKLNKKINKEGNIPHTWQEESHKAKVRQKACDARWTKNTTAVVMDIKIM